MRGEEGVSRVSLRLQGHERPRFGSKKWGAQRFLRTVVSVMGQHGPRGGPRALIGLNGTLVSLRASAIRVDQADARGISRAGPLLDISSTLGMNGPKAAISSLAGGMEERLLEATINAKSTAGQDSIRLLTPESGAESLAW